MELPVRGEGRRLTIIRRDAHHPRRSNRGRSFSVVLALGSNLGEREAHLAAARRELVTRGILELVRASAVFDTAPLGPPQPRYVNQVIQGRTHLGPETLLEATQAIERDLGRTSAARWRPRIIDIDILDYDHRCIARPDLVLPHPGIPAREFVLRPWAQIDPAHSVAGTGRTVQELLEDLEGGGLG